MSGGPANMGTKTAALPLLALIILTSSTLARAQSDSTACGQCPNLSSCNLLRSAGITNVDGVQTPGASEQDHCFAKSDLGSRFAGITIRTFNAPDSANSALNSFTVLGTWKDSSGYGDRTISCPVADCLWPGQTGGVIFSRGCYTVQGAWDAASEQQVRAKLSQLDATLRSTPCPGSAAVTPPSESLGVTLTCEHEFDNPGLVKCKATAVNPKPNAALAYDWTFDSGAQTGAAGTDLELTGVKPGAHIVGVVARDTNNGLSSDQETVSFT